ncbi:MAG TPA: GAF domain-containing protein [Terriglobales bacterium]|nr:GAF domain-containing protein [Terriglobales bacterium]
MDQYSILDEQPYQAGTKTVPRSPEPKTGLVSSAGEAREALQFPGEDGGKSLGQMAQRDLDATLQLLAERAQYITGASGAAIALREGEALICCASAGPSAPQPGSLLQVESGLSAESVRTRKTLRCDDAQNDPRVNWESCRSIGTASVVVMPLLREDRVFGVFELLSGRSHAFGERDLVALERLAEMIQTAVDHAEAARRTEQELNQPLPTAVVVPAEAEVVNHPSDPAMGMVATESDEPASAPEAVSAPEIPTNPLPPLTPAHGPATNALLSDMFEETVGQNQTQTASIEPDPAAPIRFANVGKCSACGFPVSSGRRLCLDCEAASPSPDPPVDQPLEGFGQLDSDVSWVRQNVYLVAAVLVLAATIAVVVWRF